MDLPDFLTREPDGFVRITGHRVGLEHVAFHYREGYSPEMLLEEYPTLPLSLIHKVIAFYLEHRQAVDDIMEQTHIAAEAQKSTASPAPSLAELRNRLGARRPCSVPSPSGLGVVLQAPGSPAALPRDGIRTHRPRRNTPSYASPRLSRWSLKLWNNS